MTYDEDGQGRTENDAVAELALRAAQPVQLELGGYHVIHDGGGGLTVYDLTGDSWRDTPKRIIDRVKVDHVSSLIDYWHKYADTSSEVWADRKTRTITAIIDAHPGTDMPGWQTHRATLQLHLSDPLTAWLGNNNKPLTQETFGEFVQEHIPDILHPAAADLMEMVHDLEITQSAEFKSGVRLKTGARVMSYIETIDGRTKTNQVEIPDHLTLRLPVWAGDTDTHELTAQFRFRPNQPRQGQVALLYKMDAVKDLIDGAFAALCATVAEQIDRPVFHGIPAP